MSDAGSTQTIEPPTSTEPAGGEGQRIATQSLERFGFSFESLFAESVNIKAGIAAAEGVPPDEAAAAYRRARELATNPADRRFLARRLQEST